MAKLCSLIQLHSQYYLWILIPLCLSKLKLQETINWSSIQWCSSWVTIFARPRSRTKTHHNRPQALHSWNPHEVEAPIRTPNLPKRRCVPLPHFARWHGLSIVDHKAPHCASPHHSVAHTAPALCSQCARKFEYQPVRVWACRADDREVCDANSLGSWGYWGQRVWGGGWGWGHKSWYIWSTRSVGQDSVLSLFIRVWSLFLYIRVV